MKQNIMILCYDYNLSKEVAELLSDNFSMRVLDEIELFNFDFSPRNLKEMIELNGKEFVLKKLRKIVLSECEFENVVFISHFRVLEDLQSEFLKLKENNFVILLTSRFEEKSEKMKENKSKNSDLDIFSYEKGNLDKIQQVFESNLADICVKIDALNPEQILKIILDKTNDYFKLSDV